MEDFFTHFKMSHSHMLKFNFTNDLGVLNCRWRQALRKYNVYFCHLPVAEHSTPASSPCPQLWFPQPL